MAGGDGEPWEAVGVSDRERARAIVEAVDRETARMMAAVAAATSEEELHELQAKGDLAPTVLLARAIEEALAAVRREALGVAPGRASPTEVVAAANRLARLFRQERDHKAPPEGHRFDRSTDAGEIECWNLAVIAMEALAGADAEEARALLEAGYG